MSKLLFEAMVKTGTYKDRNGQEKGRWLKIGNVFEGEKGMSMILDCVPVGIPAPVWVSFFQPKEKQQQPQQQDNGNTDDPYAGNVPF